MKKKILMLIFSILFIIPASFIFSGCFDKESEPLEIRVIGGYVQYYDYESESWQKIISVSDLKGEDGKEIEFRTTSTHIQWRYVDTNQGANANWTNIISLSDLKGKDGENGKDGKEVEFRKTSTHIQWRYVDTNQGTNANWQNLVALDDLKGEDGEDGNGIKSITISNDTTKTNEIQTTYIITFDNNTTYEFVVKNGEDLLASTYTITYDYKGLECSEYFDNYATTQTVKSNEWLTNMPTPKENVEMDIFDGWYIKGTDKKIENYDFIGGDVTLVLKFKENYTFSLGVEYFYYDKTLDGYTCDTTNSENIIVPSVYTGEQGTKNVVKVSGTTDSKSNIKSVVLPSALKEIGEYAFYKAYNLSKINIPANVTSIGDYAISYCYGLESITIPSSVTSIKKNTFEGCKSLKTITIPNGVTSIGDHAFNDCESLESVAIPESVTSIGFSAFGGCSSLETITIPNGVTSIENCAFYDCKSLESVAIPESVTSIGRYAFYDCKSLESVAIPESVTSIGESAFSHCEVLEAITIPNSITSIGESAFSHCYNLKSMIVDPANTTYDSRNNCNAIIETKTNTLIAGCRSTIIPNGVTSIGDFAFNDCRRLGSIIIPNSVTSIGLYAFSNCGVFSKEFSVFYIGNSQEWETISSDIAGFVRQTIYYYYIENQEDVPSDGGNYWHFDTDGVTPVIW